MIARKNCRLDLGFIVSLLRQRTARLFEESYGNNSLKISQPQSNFLQSGEGEIKRRPRLKRKVDKGTM